MVTNALLPSLFYGQPYRADDEVLPGPGSVEFCPHNTMHVWTVPATCATPTSRTWHLLRLRPRPHLLRPPHQHRPPVGGLVPHHAHHPREPNPGEPHTDPDWLDSSFLLYEEEDRLVRVTVRDTLYMCAGSDMYDANKLVKFSDFNC
jgi:polyphenol oxidase